jgi:uncharacterized protein (DUF4213/DUF364 family)
MINNVLKTLPDGKVEQVCIGLHWTAVVLEVGGERRCGLAATLGGNHVHGEPDVPPAGQLSTYSGHGLAEMIFSERPLLASVGTATINALMPRDPDSWEHINAEEVIVKHGAGKSVALFGHFPFVSRLATQVGKLTVLELDPQPGDLPANAATEIIPSAQVVAISGSTFINHTLSDILALCDPETLVIILGPSTFLSPVLFQYGVDFLCGAVVTEIDAVVKTIQQGGNFKQVHRAGTRLVAIRKA